MKDILLMNKIAPCGIARLGDGYRASEDAASPAGVLVRSASLLDADFPESLEAIARAGAGVNNIPLDRCAEAGIVVFNTPGANANAVKELTICALLLASRDIVEGSAWVGSLGDSELGVAKAVEKGKSRFAGNEIAGKTLGVMGFGAIGRKVADAAAALGMEVIAYDAFPVKDPPCKMASSIDELLAAADYLTLHVPSLPTTKGFVNAENIAKMKDGVRILNLARGDLVVPEDLKAALESGKVKKYVTDFPSEEWLGVPGALLLPHLGASTAEAEDNCAVMAADELKDFLENGNIRNSVNYPAVSRERDGARIVILGDARLTQDEITAAAGVDAAKLTLVRDEKKNASAALLDAPAAAADALRALPSVRRVSVK